MPPPVGEADVLASPLDAGVLASPLDADGPASSLDAAAAALEPAGEPLRWDGLPPNVLPSNRLPPNVLAVVGLERGDVDGAGEFTGAGADGAGLGLELVRVRWKPPSEVEPLEDVAPAVGDAGALITGDGRGLAGGLAGALDGDGLPSQCQWCALLDQLEGAGMGRIELTGCGAGMISSPASCTAALGAGAGQGKETCGSHDQP
ncbi:MAG TPA: hypothetical protein VFS62_09870 [Chloroflexota bacterium]|nr:hypothetical protein [Chloroflexota bacterium]